MRLIDAENLMTVTDIREDGTEITYVPYSEIESAPTAYDLNKVVEQLKDEQELSYADFEIYAEEHGLSEDDDWHYRGLGRAVEIVKRGGVDGKIN